MKKNVNWSLVSGIGGLVLFVGQIAMMAIQPKADAQEREELKQELLLELKKDETENI